MQVFTVLFFTTSLVLAFTRSALGFECIHPNIPKTIRVSKSKGHGQFSKIQDAINSIPSNNKQWIRVLVYPGTYIEQVQIPRDKQCVILEGNNQWNTIISYNAHAQTDTSATFSSFAHNFLAKNIAFQNTYNYQKGTKVTQALAARIYGDKSAFYWCRFVGIQDTLWDVRGRHYYKSCLIQGAIDFIWGSGQSVFEDCSIKVVQDKLGPRYNAGYITAQGRNGPRDPSGFVFIGGKVDGKGRTYLGRAYGTHSRVIFQHTHMSNIVVPQGWDAWHALHHEDRVTYAESRCRGPGANLSQRVKWMKKLPNVEPLSKFTVASFINQDRWINKQPNWPS